MYLSKKLTNRIISSVLMITLVYRKMVISSQLAGKDHNPWSMLKSPHNNLSTSYIYDNSTLKYRVTQNYISNPCFLYLTAPPYSDLLSVFHTLSPQTASISVVSVMCDCLQE